MKGDDWKKGSKKGSRRDLPPDLLAKTFSFVTPAERLFVVPRVSQTWAEVALSNCAWRAPPRGNINLSSFGSVLQDKHLARLAATCVLQRSVTRVCLAGAKHISDEGLQILAQSCNCITHLNLGGCTKLTDKSLIEGICKLPLVQLNLAGCGVTDRAVAGLLQCKEIRHLDLSCCRRLTDATLATLSQMPALRSVDVLGCTKLTSPALLRLKDKLQARGVDDAGNDSLNEEMQDEWADDYFTLPQSNALRCMREGEVVDDSALAVPMLLFLWLMRIFTWQQMEEDEKSEENTEVGLPEDAKEITDFSEE